MIISLLLIITYIFICWGYLQTLVVYVELGRVSTNNSIQDMIQDDQENEDESSFIQGIVYFFSCDIHSSRKENERKENRSGITSLCHQHTFLLSKSAGFMTKLTTKAQIDFYCDFFI